ncbi:Glutamyl-tRNA(Gln) amidotransferase subunit A [Sulfitobacter sp. THAF37]|uniref:amidase family protein n=1 Tax=Sulfitobacter sp. THAF37 TaxID=2587855 RepID=UPI0012691F0D|nr:amidase family protein [Sulfitobacter sp. THAF37]QFT57945.1 Glutamyl-tRNA(Gln) amidotransferase subunit A [Sulfitobacter sp. THAF37]
MTAYQDKKPHLWTAGEAVAALRSRKIGAVELLDIYLDRQTRLDGDINSVVETRADAARKAAKAVDAGSAAPGPLAGLPMTIKETFEIEGFHATAGIPELKDHLSTEDADAVARLRAAGAVIWGKTNVPLAASDHQSYNPIYGVSRNPWDTGRTVGGSSGGSAAALAAGFTALELGSDIGGSIRIPAHFCGVWGHKPTYGTVSGIGHVPPPGARSQSPLSVYGPMGRCAADLQLGMDLLAGGAAENAWVLNLPKARHDRLSDYRVAVWTGGSPVDPAYAEAIGEFADALAAQGVRITRFDTPPAPLVGNEAFYIDTLFAVIGSALPAEELEAYAAAATGHPPDSLPARVARATRSSLAGYAALVERQEALRQAWRDWFRDYDILLCPVSMTVAFPHQTEDGHGPVPQMARVLDVGGEMRPYLENLYWPGVATQGLLPATVRPLPSQVRGMPAGVQSIGVEFGDRTTLRFTELCDEVFGGFVPPPGFD